MLSAVQTGLAFYNPETGRWLSRDPIEERGGLNVNGFVQNDPVQNTDKLGLFAGPIPMGGRIVKAVCPLCNGKRYFIFTECCCKGQVISRKAIDTGVVTHKWIGSPGANGTPVHWWLTWDGGSADANSYALLMQPGDGKIASPAGATPTPNKSIPLKLSPCDYDFKKLNACLSRLAAELKSSQQWWWCWDLPPYMIKTCKEESKGCTAPP